MKQKTMAFFLVICLLLSLCANAFAATKEKSIKITGGNVCLNVGQTKKLSVSFTPSNTSNKKITWKSSNTKVMTVSSSGLVTAKAPGKVTITATSVHGKKATTTMEVVKQQSVTKVTLNKTSIKTLGKPIKLTATCSPYGSSQTITWSSSNTKVATVSKDGTVTPKGYGSCTITAKSNNGKTAKCTVNVEKSTTITKQYTIFSERGCKLQDTYTIVVDGLTGKIKDASGKQLAADWGIAVILNRNGIDVFKGDKYVDFVSQYYIKFGALGYGVTAGTVTANIRMDNQGELSGNVQWNH